MVAESELAAEIPAVHTIWASVASGQDDCMGEAADVLDVIKKRSIPS